MKRKGVNALYVWLPVVGVIALAFSGYLYSALIGLTLAVVDYPLYKWLRGRGFRGLELSPGRSRNLAAFATEGVALAAVIVGLVLPLCVLYANRGLLAAHGLALYGRTMDWSSARMAAFGSDLASKIHGAPTGMSDAWVSSLDGFWRNLSNPAMFLPWALRTTVGLAVFSVHALVLGMSMHVCLLYGSDLWEHILQHAPRGWLVTLQRLGQRGVDVLKATYVVQGVTAAAAFLIAIPVFWIIVGRPNFFLAAVLCGIFQLVPFLGSGFLLLGFFAYFLLQGEPTRAWECVFLALPLVTGIAELVVRPILARSLGRIAGVTMLVGLVAGMEAFGVAGFVLGPLCLELFVCFTAIMLYGPRHKESYLYPARTGLEERD